MNEISIIGTGLAGSEAALWLAGRGWQVRLFEMRPGTMTPAHETADAAELVCSNSLKSTRLDNPSGLLKEETRLLGSRLLPLAESCAVPAGHALAVDRGLFSERVTQALEAHPNITLLRQEVVSLPRERCLLCSGPLTSDALMRSLRNLLGGQQLYFFDAIAPIVDADSIDRGKVYRKDRYDKGEPDYLNCPFTKDEYNAFVDALLGGEKHQAHEFEDELFRSVKFSYYENCSPIEELARRGRDTLRHGVMRPMGLEREGRRPYAVLQLRAENRDETAFNLVGCQTMLRYPEQKRVFRLIPGLERAEFLRYGSIHRNSYLNSPQVLNPDLSLQAAPKVLVAGQLSGVEGYAECIATGLLAARIVAEGLPLLPEETMLGQLWRRLITPTGSGFQPANANFGILPALEAGIKDRKQKREAFSRRSLEALHRYLKEFT
jgi:methylenetetrahydrofolate--tRNA-(uracil-5-)-methyltransferase